MLRRDFVGTAAAAALLPRLERLGVERAVPAKRLLVLGGTNFVGPALVDEALARGHEVTLFNRGITRPHLFAEVEKLVGTRSPAGSDLRALGDDRRWDAVIDVWPEHRSLVRETAALLRDRTDYYAYVSSIAVYADFSVPGMDEAGRVRPAAASDYGAEKAAAEEAVRGAFDGRHGIVRCPAIVGPYDPGTSYHYWLRRLATRDEVLCPGSGLDPVQIVDVRDVARWVLDGVDTARSGTFNLTGPWPPRTMRELLTGTAEALGSPARLTWVDADFLRRDHAVFSFSDMPLWAPLDEDEGFFQIRGEAALRAGAGYRSLEETAADSWAWFRSHFFKDTTFPVQGTGISQEREDAILAAWHARR